MTLDRLRLPVTLVALIALIAAVTGCGKRELSPIGQALREVRNNPASGDAYIALGKAHVAAGNNNDAFVAFSTARELSPKDPVPACELARTGLELYDADRAIEMCRAALALKPDYPDCHVLLGRSYVMKKEPQAAIEHFERAVRYDPGHVDAQIDLVYAHAQSGNNQAALAAARRAVKANPKSARAHYTYAQVATNLRDSADAERELRKTIQLDPRHHAAMARLAMLLVDTEVNLGEARELARKAQEIDPSSGTAAATAAWALYKMGSEEEALQELLAASRSHPFNYKIWLMLSRALEDKGMKEDARRALAMAVRAAPRIPLTTQQRRLLAQKSTTSDSPGEPVRLDGGPATGEETPSSSPVPELPGSPAPATETQPSPMDLQEGPESP